MTSEREQRLADRAVAFAVVTAALSAAALLIAEWLINGGGGPL